MSLALLLMKFFHKSRHFLAIAGIIVISLFAATLYDQQQARQLRYDERARIESFTGTLGRELEDVQKAGIPDQSYYDRLAELYHQGQALASLVDTARNKPLGDFYYQLYDLQTGSDGHMVKFNLSSSALLEQADWHHRLAQRNLHPMFPEAPEDAALLLLQTLPWFGVGLIVFVLVEHLYLYRYFFKAHRGFLWTTPVKGHALRLVLTGFSASLILVSSVIYYLAWQGVRLLYKLPTQWTFPVKYWQNNWTMAKPVAQVMLVILTVALLSELLLLYWVTPMKRPR